MSFLFTLLYVGLSYIFPAEILPVLAPYRITLVIGIAGLVFSLLRIIPSGRLGVGRPQVYFLVCLTLAMAASVVWADRWIGGAAFVLQDFGISITMFLLIIWNVDSLKKLRIVVGLIVVLSVFLSAQGIAAIHYGYRAQELVIADDMSDDDTGDDVSDVATSDDLPANTVQRIRGFGMMHDPNDLALGLVCSLPFLSLAWRSKQRVRTFARVLPPVVALGYAIYLTHSRGASLAVLAMVLMASAPHIGRVKSVLLTALLACLLMVGNVSGGRAMTSVDESAKGRVDSWSEGLQMLKEQPLLGVGYRNYTDHNILTAHNSFVLCFAELGLVGYFFWIALLVTTFIQLSAVQRVEQNSSPELRKWATTLKLSLVGFLFAAFFLSRTYIPILYLLTGLAGAVTAMATRESTVQTLPALPRLMTTVAGWELGSIVFMYAFVRINMVLVK